ncbi:MAG: proprotein convertase P-domain-containing protein [Holophagaceae bacterium]
MGLSLLRRSALLALALALPLLGQDDAYKAQYQVNYKRFTRGDDVKVADEAWGRLEWFRERMGGDLSPDFSRRLLEEAERERTKYPALFKSAFAPEVPAAIPAAAWTNIGPTTSNFTQNGVTLTKVDSGRLRNILPDTTDSTGNTVYVLASGGGLWKTTNFLNAAPSWTPLTDAIGSNMSGAATFGRVTTTLYVGAGDPFDNGVGGFMVKSTNGGATWSTAVQLGTASKIYDVKVDASLGSDIVLVGTNVGLYRSTDGGSTYAAVASIAASTKVWSITKTSAGWLAAIQSTANSAGALYLSTDLGATWSAISVTALIGAGRITLAVGAPNDNVTYAYCAITAGTAQFDLLRSSDGGLSWTALAITAKAPTNSNADNTTMDLMHDQAWYNHMILVDPTDATRNTVYLGGNYSSAKTVNGGSTWTLITNWLAQYTLPYAHADFHCAAFSTFGGVSRLYFGTDGGIFTSTDGGSTWDDTKNKGLVNHLIYALAANPGVAGSALVGLQDNGTRIRLSTSSVFNQIRGGDGFGVAWAQDVTSATAVSMSSYVYNSIRRATTSPVVDQGNWTSFVTGLGSTSSTDNGASYYFVTPLITPPAGADPSGQVFFTYGNGSTGTNSKKIFQSSSTGWTAIYTAPTTGTGANVYVRAVSHGIGVSPTSLQTIAAAGNGGYVLLTSNGGSTWTPVFLGSTGTDGQNIGWTGFNSNIAWANNNLLYICSESVTAGAAHVAKSANGGTTWTRADALLPDVPVTKLVVDPGDATGNTVYAATWLGVYRTTNGGTSWSVFGTGLPQGRATDIWIAPDSTSIRVSTWGRGVWEIAVPLAPSILAQPAAATAAVGHTATFTVRATGSGTLTYLWKKNGNPISLATADTYTTPTLTLADTGAAYSCDVTNSVSTTSSASATLTVQALGGLTSVPSTTVTAIPDAVSASTPGAAVEVPFVISGVTGTVGEVTVSMYLTHSYVGDLVITLVAPDNSTVIVSNGAGAGSGAASNTAAFGSSCGTYAVLSDLGSASIDAQSSPPAIVGTFRPSFPLTAFNGKSPNGTWKLRFQDFGVADTGSFVCGILSIKPFLSGPSITLAPTTATMVQGGTQTFTPTVTNGSTNLVTWSATSGILAATETSSGNVQTYTAPNTGTSATITATTQDAPIASAFSAITLVAPSAVTVTVTPAAIEMMIGSGTQQFASTVSPITNTAVNWSIAGGSGLSATGLFNASGLASGNYTVTATSLALTSPPISGSATVTLVAPSAVTVAVSPTTTSVLVGSTKQFTPTVSGVTPTNQGVTWSVTGTGGTINATTGLFTATTAGTCTVTATNTFSGKTASATVTVNTPASVALAPTAITMVQGGTQAFTPTVTGGASATVTWSATSGSISAGPTASGVAQTYTAPASGTTDTVTTTTVDAPNATASSTVTLVAPNAITVGVTPATVEMMVGSGTQQFTSTVSTITNTAVNWSVTGGAGLSATGLFSSTGLAAGAYTVTATSQAAPSRAGTATVTLIAPSSVSVAVSPGTPAILVGGTQQFTATVGGLAASHQGVTWSVSGGGTITSAGLFTGTTAGTFTVTATNAFSGVQGTAPVTVQTPVSIFSFAASKPIISAGSSTTLAWAIANSTSQSIDNGPGAVAAAGSVSVTPSATTTYSLTAQGPGGPVTRTVTITVVALPSITTFSVTPTIILPNRSATLLATFSGGIGGISPGVGAVVSGSQTLTPLLSASATYTLVVTNAAGDAVSATATVTVSPSLNFDLNADGIADLRDLLAFAKYFGSSTALADFNGDGQVDDLDLAILMAGL